MPEAGKTVKCVVWDLDDTVWDGILLEDGDDVEIRPEVVDTLRTLDGRGILHSIASRNEPEPALARLRDAGLHELFLHAQIGWGRKSDAVRHVAESLNLGLDTFAFVDDDPFERAEVASVHPEVLVLDARNAAGFPDLSRLRPSRVTEDGRRRRAMYVEEQARERAEGEFEGPSQAFLGTLGLRMEVFPPADGDLERASELTVRTNQLNSTGLTCSEEDLDRLRLSGRHTLLLASLEDRFGSYGRVGLCLLERDEEVWTIRLLLMSCRVLSRGAGTILLNHVMTQAEEAGVRLRGAFVATDRNRPMYATYKFAGFEEVGEEDGVVLLESDLACIQPCPDWVELTVTD